jgi:hypothetical protein
LRNSQSQLSTAIQRRASTLVCLAFIHSSRLQHASCGAMSDDRLARSWCRVRQMSTSAVFSRAGVLADTLHRFCKKEHDWGWKKFMELNKVFDGFTVDNQLVIKAQVQV